MEKSFKSLNEIKLIGIKVHTNNNKEFNPQTARISPCIQQFISQDLANQIPERKKPNVTFCAYAQYESDHKGEYTFFIGEEVSSINKVPLNMHILIIPAQKYTKFTTKSGIIPNIIIESWQKIWNMSPKELGGYRNYNTDFELYDHRAIDQQNAVVDIFIGIK